MPEQAVPMFLMLLAGTLLPVASQGVARTLHLDAVATNTASTFRQYLFSFPLPSAALLTGISGSISIQSDGQGFAEALVSVDDLPAGAPCPESEETFESYADIRAHHPALRTLAKFIVKQPRGSRASSVVTEFRLPRSISVDRCLLVILDGAVLRVGGAFQMSSNIIAQLATLGASGPPAEVLPLDDEFCFDRSSGCELATIASSGDSSFMRVLALKQSGMLLALYGNISDSAFGWQGSQSPTGAWTMRNSYYLYPKCSLAEGPQGPADYFAQIPAMATELLSLEMAGSGQRVLQKPVNRLFRNTAVLAGDCLVHLVRMTAVATLGGVDAESQVMALIAPSTVP